MANVDVALLTFAGLVAAYGFYQGAIQQVSEWIGLATAILLSKPAAAAAAPLLAERMGWPLYLTSVGLSAVSMPVVLIAATLLSRLIINAIIPGDQRNMPDRITGLFLGGGKAAVVAWAGLSVLLAFEKPLSKVHSGIKPALGASKAASFTREHSLFDAPALSLREKLNALAAMKDDPKLSKALLKEQPALKALLSDASLKVALEKGETGALLENPEIKKLLENPRLGETLEGLAGQSK